MRHLIHWVLSMPEYGIIVGALAAGIVLALWRILKGRNVRWQTFAAMGAAVVLAVLALYGPYRPELSVQPYDNLIMCDVDFSKDEYAKRFDIPALDYTGYCASGSGNGFSHEPGSHCSSLGLYKVTGSKWSKKVGRALILEGLSDTNDNARYRGILVHGSKLVDGWRYGLRKKSKRTSEGCFTVDGRTLDKLMTLHRRGMTIYIIAHK